MSPICHHAIQSHLLSLQSPLVSPFMLPLLLSPLMSLYPCHPSCHPSLCHYPCHPLMSPFKSPLLMSLPLSHLISSLLSLLLSPFMLPNTRPVVRKWTQSIVHTVLYINVIKHGNRKSGDLSLACSFVRSLGETPIHYIPKICEEQTTVGFLRAGYRWLIQSGIYYVHVWDTNDCAYHKKQLYIHVKVLWWPAGETSGACTHNVIAFFKSVYVTILFHGFTNTIGYTMRGGPRNFWREGRL